VWKLSDGMSKPLELSYALEKLCSCQCRYVRWGRDKRTYKKLVKFLKMRRTRKNQLLVVSAGVFVQFYLMYLSKFLFFKLGVVVVLCELL
jgi:hypothetical protein